MRSCKCMYCTCVCLSICVPLASQHIYATPHRQRFTSNAINSIWAQLFIICGIPTRCSSLLFYQRLDTMLRGVFSCEKRPCHSQLMTCILNRMKCSLTNELCSHNRTDYWRNYILKKNEKEKQFLIDKRHHGQNRRALSFPIRHLYSIVCLCCSIESSIVGWHQMITLIRD